VAVVQQAKVVPFMLVGQHPVPQQFAVLAQQ
jgi:hypothetical protein